MATNIKKAREAAGKSQKEIAITLGVSAPTVSDWEAGKMFPSAKNLVQLADYLNVSTDYLLGHEKPAPSGADEAGVELTEDKLTILKLTDGFSPEQMKSLIAFLKGLLESPP